MSVTAAVIRAQRECLSIIHTWSTHPNCGVTDSSNTEGSRCCALWCGGGIRFACNNNVDNITARMNEVSNTAETLLLSDNHSCAQFYSCCIVCPHWTCIQKTFSLLILLLITYKNYTGSLPSYTEPSMQTWCKHSYLTLDSSSHLQALSQITNWLR